MVLCCSLEYRVKSFRVLGVCVWGMIGVVQPEALEAPESLFKSTLQCFPCGCLGAVGALSENP